MRPDTHPDVKSRDLPEIYAYIARSDPAAAERVLAAIQATFQQLAEQPLSGVVYFPKDRRLAGLRMLPVNRYRNYLIFYRADAPQVRILYVVHGARHLRRFFAKHPRD